MGWIKDLLTEVPLSAVLQQRIALAEQKFDRAVAEAEELRQRVADLEREVTELRAQLPAEPTGDFSDDMGQVLGYLFRCKHEDCDVGALAQHLQMERGVAEYNLEQLDARGLAVCTGGNYIKHHAYWGLTPEGRRYVVENGLISE